MKAINLERQGKVFVFEGTDGSGKKTQSELCYQYLKEAGYPVMKLDFPRYGKASAYLVERYLKGDFGLNANEVDPYLSSSFYAQDRFVSYKTEFGEFYNNGGIIILDRYTTSNMVHQAGKIKDMEEKEHYLNWLYCLEFEVYGLPVPDMVFFLAVPPAVTIELMKGRLNKFSGEEKKDIHESNPQHLTDSYENAMYLIEKYNWDRIDCVKEDNLRTIEDIQEEIRSKILKLI